MTGIMNQMKRAAEHVAAFPQSTEYERGVKLLKNS